MANYMHLFAMSMRHLFEEEEEEEEKNKKKRRKKEMMNGGRREIISVHIHVFSSLPLRW